MFFSLYSLQATWIRNTVLRAIRETYPSIARELPTTFVYDHPSIASLAHYLSGCVIKETAAALSRPEDKRQQLDVLVEKYTKSFPPFDSSRATESDKGGVVLLTGSTGTLGSSLLATLIESSDVDLVYCLSRRTSEGISVKERHHKAFEREGYDRKLLDSDKVRLLEGDTSLQALDLVTEQYIEVNIREILQQSAHRCLVASILCDPYHS